MQLTVEKTDEKYTARGKADDVVSLVEEDSRDMAHIVMGAMATTAANKEKEVIIDSESSEEIDDRPFEVVVHQDQKGDVTKFEFRFLDEEESHG